MKTPLDLAPLARATLGAALTAVLVLGFGVALALVRGEPTTAAVVDAHLPARALRLQSDAVLALGLALLLCVPLARGVALAVVATRAQAKATRALACVTVALLLFAYALAFA